MAFVIQIVFTGLKLACTSAILLLNVSCVNRFVIALAFHGMRGMEIFI
jgi:hypothetical protein